MRGGGNVHKKFLFEAMACNLALPVRALYGAGKPKAAGERAAELFLALLMRLLWCQAALQGRYQSPRNRRLEVGGNVCSKPLS